MLQMPINTFNMPETQIDNIIFFLDNRKLKLQWPRRWHNGLERSPCKRKVRCLDPSQDRPKSKKKQDSKTPLPNGIRCECHGLYEINIINRCPIVTVGVAS